jgi:hypothetical protein
MSLHHVICAVRQRPEPEIVEMTVPVGAVASWKRRLTLKGFETVFTIRTLPLDARKPNG